MFSALAYYTGLIVIGVLLGLAIWIFVFELLVVGSCTAISFLRCSLASPTSTFSWRKHGLELVFKSFPNYMIEFWGHRNNGKRNYYFDNGYWRGIGDWRQGNVKPSMWSK